MKHILFVILSPLTLFSQNEVDTSFKPYAEYEGLFLFNKSRFIGGIKSDTSYYPGGKNIKAIGSYVMDTYSNIKGFKFGQWTEYYVNGKIKSQGAYDFCSTYSCCSGSLCMLYYSHKVNEWTYFYQHGELKAKGKYKIELVPEGRIEGETVKKSTIDSSWILLDEHNNKLIPEGNIKVELEKEDK